MKTIVKIHCLDIYRSGNVKLFLGVAQSDIYHRLKQVLKIGANEDITFKTHEFQLFEQEHSTNYSQIETLDQFIPNGSLILIKLRPKHIKHRIGLNGETLYSPNSLTFNDSSKQQTIKSDVNLIKDNYNKKKISGIPQTEDQNNDLKVIPKFEPSVHPIVGNSSINNYELNVMKEVIKDFHSIVLAINIGWNFRTGGLSIWEKVSTALNGLNPPKRIPCFKCRSIFETCIKFYAKNFHRYEGHIHPSSQIVFDLLKVCHTLDFDKFYPKSDPIFIQIDCISKQKEMIEYFGKHLTQIRAKKLNQKELDSRPQPSSFTKKKQMDSVLPTNNDLIFESCFDRLKPENVRQILNPRIKEKNQFCVEVEQHSSTSVSDIISQANDYICDEEEVIPTTYSQFLKFKSNSVTKSDETVLRTDSNYSKNFKRLIDRQNNNRVIEKCDPLMTTSGRRSQSEANFSPNDSINPNKKRKSIEVIVLD